MTDDNELKIAQTWQQNARPWITAIEQDEIQSRLLVTNQAIINAIKAQQRGKVLDVGCGEGWLVRELQNAGIEASGVDMIPDLLDYARQQSDATYYLADYINLTKNLPNKAFDVVVSNFSALGKDSVDQLFQQVPKLLKPKGCFILQTLNPVIVNGEHEYVDGWREGTWDGFSNNFTNPAPWYFRTLESWQALFEKNGFKVTDVIEPRFPDGGELASVIFVGRL